jgi:hypothetical protein
VYFLSSIKYTRDYPHIPLRLLNKEKTMLFNSQERYFGVELTRTTMYMVQWHTNENPGGQRRLKKSYVKKWHMKIYWILNSLIPKLFVC